MRSLLYALAFTLVLHSSASAGPVESLQALAINPVDPSTLGLVYKDGGGGLFVSEDAGKSFRLLCNSAIDPSIMRAASALFVRSDGSLLMGLFDGLWQGGKGACGFAKSQSFDQLWLDDFAVDPYDPNRVYTITSTGGVQNGVYANDVTSNAWTKVGAQDAILLNRLHVVATGAGKRRIYESAVRGTIDTTDPVSGQTSSLPRYVVRVSNDDGQSWTEHDFGRTDGSMRLIGVDPQHPDHIVAAVLRDADQEQDDLSWSDSQGSAGSFRPLGQVMQLGGATFTPDGRFFYGDHDSANQALYAVAKLGDAPKQLSTKYQVSCLQYEPKNQLLYLCQDRLFGTADPESGEFKLLFDITKTEHFVQCPGAASTENLCQAQLLSAFCGITHYPDAPVCAGYNLLADAGTTGSAGASAANGGDAGTPKATPTSSAKHSGGCSLAQARGAPTSSFGVGLALISLLLLRLARRARPP